jgi:hypothetical protein
VPLEGTFKMSRNFHRKQYKYFEVNTTLKNILVNISGTIPGGIQNRLIQQAQIG